MAKVEIPAGAGWTALLTAYSRAQESRGADPLFEDPLATAFVAAVHGADLGGRADLPRLGPANADGTSTLWNAFHFYFTGRTPFYDEKISAAADDGCRQVVVLGAGLDSRVYRLAPGDGVTVFELDRAPVHEFKDTVLRRQGAVPTCVRVPVVADLTQGLSRFLLPSGFDPAVPTMWVVEGLLMYLSREEADELLRGITALSAPGSRIAGEYFDRHWSNADVGYDALGAQDRAAWDLLMGAFRYGPVADHPGEWLSVHGWGSREVTTIRRFGGRTGREVPGELARPGAPQVWLFAGAHSADDAAAPPD
ncbi:SAM-dependent methyltransferase [Actinomadura sp. DC4]|uniref:SAM-dependent methyltransferase n=1 Tax=Actinomadura sp. DC4 TaxID=3055069 RepID=UPI0025AF6706|nr:SAM-dependent methyltransferase [Actinomadura sp. DC4]MDN3359628.1 SAM-dependent methyltransferase [Actinomadura sp. DC4]